MTVVAIWQLAQNKVLQFFYGSLGEHRDGHIQWHL